MNSNPLVSIVTVVYNGQTYLEQTIQSVLSQSYENIEYIVIDGGSTDGTVGIIKKYEENIAHWVSEQDDGQTDALIKGFNASNGDILYWINYDDLLFSQDTIEKVVHTFVKTNADLVYGNDMLVDENAQLINVRDFRCHSFGKLLYYKSISQPSTFFSKHMYDTFGLNKTLEYSMDLDLWLHIFKTYNTVYMNGILSKNRIHSERKMLKFQHEAEQEAMKLRLHHGASKTYFTLRRYIYKIAEIRNHMWAKWLKISYEQ